MSAEDLRNPISVRPNATVENRYALVDPDQRAQLAPFDFHPAIDRRSVRRAKRFLKERFKEGRKKDDADPSVVPDTLGYDRMLLPPKVWAALSLGTLIVSNLAINAESVPKLFDKVFHDKSPTHTVTHPAIKRLKTFTAEHRTAQTQVSHNEVGQTAPEQSYREALAEIKHIYATHGDNLRNFHIVLTGNSSDEYLGKPGGSYEKLDPENKKYALDRANNYLAKLRELAAKENVQLPPIKVSYKEHVLSHELHQRMENEAKHFGYANLAAAETVYDQHPEKLPPSLRRLIDTKSGQAERGVNMYYLYDTKETKRVTVVNSWQETVKEHIPWSPITFPFPNIPLFRREPVITAPGEPDDEWLRLYEEALLPDGTLRKDAWAYTRKYQHLFREDRIKAAYQANFTDARGREQSLNLMFVDHEPTDEVMAAFGDLLQKFAHMKKGDFAQWLDMIAVFPTDNAGLYPNDPKRIGLGFDAQREAGVLGLAFPTLGIFEMHMDPSASREQLHGYMTPTWVFGHEGGGHFSDHNLQPATVHEIGRHRRQRLYVPKSQWADRGDQAYQRLVDEQGNPRAWRIKKSGSRKLRGWPSNQQMVVPDGDPRIVDADLIRTENRFPTQYAKTDPGELWAESVAQAMDNQLIPETEQGANLHGQGYAIDEKTLRNIQRELGADETADDLRWGKGSRISEWHDSVQQMRDDAKLRANAARARRWRFRRKYDPKIIRLRTQTRVTEDKSQS